MLDSLEYVVSHYNYWTHSEEYRIYDSFKEMCLQAENFQSITSLRQTVRLSLRYKLNNTTQTTTILCPNTVKTLFVFFDGIQILETSTIRFLLKKILTDSILINASTLKAIRLGTNPVSRIQHCCLFLNPQDHALITPFFYDFSLKLKQQLKNVAWEKEGF